MLGSDGADATRGRKLPGEVWAVGPASGPREVLRWYLGSRVIYRALAIPDGEELASSVRRVLARIRRGFDYASALPWWRAAPAFVRFRLGR